VFFRGQKITHSTFRTVFTYGNASPGEFTNVNSPLEEMFTDVDNPRGMTIRNYTGEKYCDLLPTPRETGRIKNCK
jgi:hypothetical protein